MEIVIMQGSLLSADADVIVNPANSLGLMGGGVAKVIKKSAGDEVEEEAKRYAPIPSGEAVSTTAGNLKFKGIIHAPTIEVPGMCIPLANVGKATKAALKLADEKGFSTMAFPGMGTGMGGIKKEIAANAMIDTINNFKAQSLKKIILIDVDADMVEEWSRIISNKR